MRKFITIFIALAITQILNAQYTRFGNSVSTINLPYKVVTTEEKVLAGYDTTFTMKAVTYKKPIEHNVYETVIDNVTKEEDYCTATITIKGENGNTIKQWANAYISYKCIEAHSYGNDETIIEFEGNINPNADKYYFLDRNFSQVILNNRGIILVENIKTSHKETKIGSTKKKIAHTYTVTETVTENQKVVDKYIPIYETITQVKKVPLSISEIQDKIVFLDKLIAEKKAQLKQHRKDKILYADIKASITEMENTKVEYKKAYHYYENNF